MSLCLDSFTLILSTEGLGCGLEVPVEYIFIGDVKAINWLLGRVEKMDKALDGRVQKCMK